MRLLSMIVLVLTLSLYAGTAYAACTYRTYILDGRVITCTTCCFGGVCTTNCY